MAVAPQASPGAAVPAQATRGKGGRGEDRDRISIVALFLAPAMILLGIFLVFPALYTIALSFFRGRANSQFAEFVGLTNYVNLLTNDPKFINFGTFPPSGAIWNNILWLVFYTSITLFLGLVIAVMATRVRYEKLIKAIVFIPQAIAATALGVIWTFVYSPNPDQGLLNALLGIFGIGPISWLGDTTFVNAALIFVGIWAGIGFATVILSAAIKSISTEILEAARSDGANEIQIFFRIILPMVSLPMSVLAVTLIVGVVKLFDLIYVLTNGGPGVKSRVVAFTMYQESIPGGQFGRGAAVAVIMLILLTPIMAYNIRRFRSSRVT